MKAPLPYGLPLLQGTVVAFMAFVLIKFAAGWPAWLALPLAIFGGGAFAMMAWFSVRDYVSEVEDAGTHLVARRGAAEEIIQFGDIDFVEFAVMRPAGITLHLNRDSRFGRRIKYHPDVFPWGIAAEAERIRERCPAAHRSPGHASD